MTFTIGSTDITPYIAYQGLTYQLSDVDSPNAGRDLSGTMQRSRIAEKDKFGLSFIPLTTAQHAMIIGLVSGVNYVTVTYTSPSTGSQKTATMYVGDRTSAYCQMNADGTELWMNLKFSLIER